MLMHSQIMGEGTPFLILHGFLGSGDNWKTLGKKWADDGYQIHLLDQRNHGHSFHSDDFSYEIMADDVLRYCEENDLSEIILLGHSMGGKTAMEFVTSHPEKVDKLIVADIAPKSYPQHHQDILKALSSLDFEKIKSRSAAEKVLSEYIPDLGIRQFLLKNLYWKEKGKLALRMNLKVLSEKIDEVGKALPEERVFKGATLFLRGENSGYITEMDEILIKKHFPKAKVKTVSKSGHWLHAENPEEFYQYVIDFL